MKRFATILFLVVALSPAFGITRVQSKSANTAATSATTVTATFTSTPTVGNVIVVAAAYNSAGGYVTATNIHFLAFINGGNNGTISMIAVGRVFGSPGSAITLNCVSSNNMAIVAVEYSGLGLPLFDKTATSSGNSGSPTSGATDTTTAANALRVAAICARGTNANTFSAPTNSFSIVDQTNSSTGSANADRSVAFLEKIVSATGTEAAGATMTTNNWAAVQVVLQPSQRGWIGLLMRDWLRPFPIRY